MPLDIGPEDRTGVFIGHYCFALGMFVASAEQCTLDRDSGTGQLITTGFQ